MGAVKWLFLLFLLCGCSHVKYIGAPEYHYRDSIRVTEKTDSFIFRDSVFVSVVSKGETVYIERDRWRYRNVVKLRTDTFAVFKCDTITNVVTISEKNSGRGRIRWYEVLAIAVLTAIVFFIGKKLS